MAQTLTLLIPDEMDIDEARSACVEAIGWMAHDYAAADMEVFNAGRGASSSEISIAPKTGHGIVTIHGIVTVDYDSTTGIVNVRAED